MKPLKATQVKDIDTLKYPLYASPKYDGIRAITTTKGFLSNSLKPLPNKQLQDSFLNYPEDFTKVGLKYFLDGEITLENPTASFNDVQSVVMSKDKKDQLIYRVFDTYKHPNIEYMQRFLALYLADTVVKLSPTLVVVRVEQRVICTPKSLLEYEERVTSQGYEGVMLRSPSGIYKHGRSTLKEGYLLKLKKFKDDEALVVGFNELYLNQNDPTISELGLQVRSSKLAGKVAANTLGSIVLDHPLYGQFSCGSGFTQAQRQEIWDHQSEYLGKFLKFKYLDCSIKNSPRHPVFLGFRHQLDISN